MKRAGVFTIAVASAVLAATACAPGEAPENVLVVTLDTTRADRMGVYGGGKETSPHFDRFAGDGVLFLSAVAPAPVTLPSHATMFTGRNPYSHGVRYNAIRPLPEIETTLAERFRDAGFRTAAFVSSFAVHSRFGLNQGFDTYDDAASGDGTGREVERPADRTLAPALAWWEANTGERRFLWVHFYDPHWEYEPPFPYSSQFVGRPYEGEIAFMDSQLGVLLDRLRASGEIDRTLVVVAGDHGEGLYDHGERWHSDLVYESTQHVPLVIRDPRGRAGATIADPVGLADLAPTILALMGLEGFPDADGRTLTDSVLRGEEPGIVPVYYEAMGGHINFGWSPLFGIRLGKWKYFEGGRAEMYDLASDPAELTDLAAADPEQAATLSEAISAFREKAIGSERPIEDEPRLDETSLAMLRSLGYIGGGTDTIAATGRGPHPPEMVAIESEFQVAQEAVSRNDWTTAAGALDFILRTDPTNKFALFHRPSVFLEEGRNEEAIALASTFHRLYGDAEVAYDQYGMVLVRAGRPGDAVAVFAEGIERFPDNQRFRFRKVLSAVEAGQAGSVRRDVEFLEREHPDDPASAIGRALLEAAEGREAAAVAALVRALDLGYRDGEAIESSAALAGVRRSEAYAAIRPRVQALVSPAGATDR